MRFPTSRNQVAVLAALLLIPAGALAQGEEGPSPASLTVSPEEITLTAGETAQIEATALDEDGNEVEVEFLYLPLYGQYWNLDKRTWGFNIFKVSREGEVSTRRPGEFAVMVRVVGSGPDPSARNSEAEGYLQQRIPLTILPRPVASLNVTAEGPLYAGTEITVRAEPLDDTGALVEGLEVTWMSSDDAVAMPIARPPTIERTRTRGVLTLGTPGAVTVTATAGAASAEMAVEVVPNPVAKMELTPDRSTARTGDVTHLEVTMTDAAGATLEGVPVGFSVSAMTDAMGMGGPSSGLITQDGRFVAELPGVYTVVARTGSVSASTVIRIAERGVRRPIELVGHGRVKDRATSDLWVWEAPNGRDYAMTGTHSAAGHAYIWDVTDPEDLDIVDVVRVDARTVNDEARGEPWEFPSKSLPVRMAVIAAGPMMNFVFAFAVFVVVYGGFGVDTVESTIVAPSEGSVAETAGLRRGDVVRAFDGESVSNAHELVGGVEAGLRLRRPCSPWSAAATRVEVELPPEPRTGTTA